MKFGMLMFLGLLKLNLDLWNSQPGVSKPPPNCGRRSHPPGRMAQPPCRWGAKPLTLGQMKAVLWGRWSCPQPSEEKQGTRPKGSYPFLYVQMLIWIPDLLHRHFPCWWKLTPPPLKSNISFFSVNIAGRVLKTWPSSNFGTRFPMVPLVFFYDH